MRICGDLGFKNAKGEPCGQAISAESKGCIWHTSTPERRAFLARLGGHAQAHTPVPETYDVPELKTVESIQAAARDLTKMALKDTNVDLRRIKTARECVSLALAALEAQTQRELVDALLRLEHGGASFALLAKMTESITAGRSRPLPSRVLPVGDGKNS